MDDVVERADAGYSHAPVMLTEVTGMLNLQANMDCIDMTVGLGGHAAALLDATAPAGRLLAIDRDAAALDVAGRRLARFGQRVAFARSSFAQARACAKEHGFDRADAILFDLGVSSPQLDTAGRGFSFQEDAALDMRMDQDMTLTAEYMVNTWSEAELEKMLREFGDEVLAHPIARAICRRRAAQRIATTTELAKLVSGVYYGRGWRRSRLHPATKTFQALRIAVNDELGQLRAGLDAALALLADGGRMAVISFHSGEDRVVKQYFRTQEKETGTGRAVTKKPLQPSSDECAGNPRARSAKMRVFGKTGADHDR